MTDREQKDIFGRNLTYFVSRRRRETGQTQKDIAIAMGFSPTTFNTWCTGGAMPSVGVEPAPVGQKVKELSQLCGLVSTCVSTVYSTHSTL